MHAMTYTIENLQTQLKNKELAIKQEKHRQHLALQVDYPPAVNYGEGTRINHLRTINANISHYERQCLELKIKIQDMKEQEEID